MQSRDEIEVLLAGAVVEQDLALGKVGDRVFRDRVEALGDRVVDRQLQEIERLAGIARSQLGNGGESRW